VRRCRNYSGVLLNLFEVSGGESFEMKPRRMTSYKKYFYTFIGSRPYLTAQRVAPGLGYFRSRTPKRSFVVVSLICGARVCPALRTICKELSWEHSLVQTMIRPSKGSSGETVGRGSRKH